MSKTTPPPKNDEAQRNSDRRLVAIQLAEYGPPKPEEVNANFWRAKAKTWGTDSRDAQTMRCANCGSFQSGKAALEKMKEIPLDSLDPPSAGEPGYCDTYEFRVTSKRVCDSWMPKMMGTR